MRRILTIDGGGIRGVFQASFLATIEDTIHDKISSYFDLMVETSTRGIMSLMPSNWRLSGNSNSLFQIHELPKL